MVSNRVLLGSIAFGISAGLGLLVFRDLGRSVVTGIITLPASYVSSNVVRRRSYVLGEDRIAELQAHIRALQQRRMEEFEALAFLETQHHQVAAAADTQLLQPVNPWSAVDRDSQAVQSPPALPYRNPKPAVSWNLSAPPGQSPSVNYQEALAPTLLVTSEGTPTQLQSMPSTQLTEEVALDRLRSGARSPRSQPASQEMAQYIQEAEATKRKVEANINQLNAELAQLRVDIAEHRQMRDRLQTELAALHEQKAKLEAGLPVRSVADRQELARCLAYTEQKQQQLSQGNHPLQLALQQYQSDLRSLHTDLQGLHHSQGGPSTSERRDRPPTSATVTAQPTSSATALQSPTMPPTMPPNIAAPLVAERPARKVEPPPSKKSGIFAVALPKFGKLESSTSAATANLPQDWATLANQMPDSERQALRAIAQSQNPAPQIKQISEAHLTMPELLIDAINERSLDTIGDILIEVEAGKPVVAAEYGDRVEQILKLFEG